MHISYWFLNVSAMKDNNNNNDIENNQDFKDYWENAIKLNRKLEKNSEIFQLGREFHEKSMQNIDKDLTFAEFIMIKVDPKNNNLNLNDEDTFKSLKENIIKEMCEPIQNQIEIATAVNYDNIIDEMKKELMIYNLEKEIKNIKNSFNDFKTLKDVEKKLREDKENIKTFERVLINSWTESAMQDQKLTFEQN